MQLCQTAKINVVGDSAGSNFEQIFAISINFIMKFNVFVFKMLSRSHSGVL